MKRQILILLISCAIYGSVNAQNDSSGIHFEQNLTWYQIMSKAKAEKKYVFVDCYTTWCGPCKRMDNEVYNSEKVAAYFNSHFICIKVQMDKTPDDNEKIKSWYNIAEMLSSSCTVNVYPTYLFFMPQGPGIPLHKATSYKPAEEFIAVGADALDSNRQYYTMVKNFKPGTMDTSEMKAIALLYKIQNKTDIVEKIVLDYLDRIPALEKFDSANKIFLEQFTNSPKIRKIVTTYLKGLTKKQFGEKQNQNLAIAFCNYDNLPVQALCINYLKGLNKQELSDTSNLKFLAALNPLPELESIAISYLKSLSLKEFEKKVNVRLATAFKKNKEIQVLANNQISHMGQEDLNDYWVIEFIGIFTQLSQGHGTKISQANGFNLLYQYPDQVNRIMNNKKYSRGMTDYFISVEMIDPVIKSDAIQPDWEDMHRQITTLYDSGSANRTIIAAKTRWYRRKEDWDHYFPLLIENMNRTGIDTSNGMAVLSLNNLAYDEIFMHSNDKKILSAALGWMEAVLRKVNYKSPPDIDTYANLLYKLGRVSEAIIWETKAVELSFNSKLYRDALEKMNKSEPTWVESKSAQ